jgi:Tat protein translocase TatB subunit
MPQIGAPEILMVAVIGLIVFGPRRLPEIARSLGKSFAEFKRQASEVRAEFAAGLDPETSENPAPEDEKPAPAATTEDPAPHSEDEAPPT